jgi:hypothetical protein
MADSVTASQVEAEMQDEVEPQAEVETQAEFHTAVAPTPAQVQAQAAAEIEVDAITIISLTDLAEKYKVWHFITTYAGDFMLVQTFGETGGAWLDHNNPELFDQYARESLTAVFLAYTTVMETVVIVQVMPEPRMSQSLPDDEPH